MIAALLGTGLATAQGYYDDDIYFDASKAKKATKSERVVKNQRYDFPAADTYAPEGISTRSVDEYNRRGIFAVPHATDTISVDSLAALGNFSSTRRIERFHNPEVVTSNPDQELAELYYNDATPATINLYINSPYYWGGYWGSYWGSPWAYDPFWGPSWSWGWGPSWSWGWGPSWSWGWGPSWSWGWGPSWSWGWGGPAWGWGGPAWAPSRPNVGRPINGNRPGADANYQGSYRRNAQGNRQYSGSRWNIDKVGRNPGNNVGISNPSHNNSGGIQYRPGANGSYRGGATSRGENNNSGSYRRNQSNRSYNGDNSSRNTGSYRSNSGSSRGSMGTSIGSGGGSYRGGAGGSYRGGGGGGSRGGRR